MFEPSGICGKNDMDLAYIIGSRPGGLSADIGSMMKITNNRGFLNINNLRSSLRFSSN
jgi:hypothetical protein